MQQVVKTKRKRVKMNEVLKDHYERINRVLQYIDINLSKRMDLDELASQANYSVYHFHRIMRAHLGESLGSYIVRVRLETAAHLLRHCNIPINEVALRVGYDAPSSFNKAFKKRFGISPLKYKEDKIIGVPNYGSTLIDRNMETIELKPKIKELKPVHVIYVQAKGAYNESAKEAWGKVCAYAQQKKLFGFKTDMIGISHDDPGITESDKLRYDACISIKKEVKPEGEVGVKEIPGGKYAIFTHKGPYENFNETYGFIFGKWVPENNIELRDTPCFEKYLNDPGKTKPEKLRTEVYIPIS